MIIDSEKYRKVPVALGTIEETVEDDVLVLRGTNQTPKRRLLFLSNYGMAQAWRLWKQGFYPGNHLWGCLELSKKGYEILLPEPVTGKGMIKRFRNDWLPARIAASRLKPDDIVYCAHNILLWTPLLKTLKAICCKIVGLLFAREPLLFGNIYDGIIAHTPVASKHAALLYPKAACEHISWGMDLDFFQLYPYEPRWFLSCGKTFRDFEVIAEAFRDTSETAMLIHPQPEKLIEMPPNISIQPAHAIGERIYAPLAHHYYRYSIATLLAMMPDPTQRHSIGLTNLFESMVCGRPLIVTRTSALTSEIDVENSGIGLYVEQSDAVSLRKVIDRLVNNPDEAEEMGLKGRRLCEKYYNMDRFALDLDAFFEKL